MKKIHVSICTGTTCYLMGGAHLLTVDELLDPDTVKQIELSGSHCLGFCNNESCGKAPFATVNGQVISDATATKLAQKIHEIIEEEA